MKTRTIYYCCVCDEEVNTYTDGKPMCCGNHLDAGIYSAEEEVEYVTDFSKMTSDDFDHALVELLTDKIESMGPSNFAHWLLSQGDIYTELAEDMNNDVLDLWDQQERDKYYNEEE